MSLYANNAGLAHVWLSVFAKKLFVCTVPKCASKAVILKPANSGRRISCEMHSMRLVCAELLTQSLRSRSNCLQKQSKHLIEILPLHDQFRRAELIAPRQDDGFEWLS